MVKMYHDYYKLNRVKKFPYFETMIAWEMVGTLEKLDDAYS